MRPSPEEFTVGWICALWRERSPAHWMLDEEYEPFPQDSNDTNQYTLGRIGTHYVVIVGLPSGEVGLDSAATVVARMLATFKSLQFGLLVGIGGGIPSAQQDLRLGDIVVGDAGVIQYDKGKRVQGGRFVSTGAPWPASQRTVLGVAKLRSELQLQKRSMRDLVNQMVSQHPEFACPGAHQDVLYRADYDHPEGGVKGGGETCANCDPGQRVVRPSRPSEDPVVHYGLIGSASCVMKHGGTREELREQYNILCVEMEASAVVRMMPSLVIRGVSDYADSHKNKQWQNYAALTAATYAKSLLYAMQAPASPNRLPSMIPLCKADKFVGRQDILAQMSDLLTRRHLAVLAGIGGVGKTQLVIQYCARVLERRPALDIFWVNASTPINFEQAYRQIAMAQGIDAQKETQITLCSMVCERLSRPGSRQWLMVLDNLDDVDILAPLMRFVPNIATTQNHGRLIVTTRNHQVCQTLPGWTYMSDRVIKVPPLPHDDASALLRSALPDSESLNEDDLQHVVRVLCCIPLALTQAVAFIQHYTSNITGYKKLLLKKPRQQLRDKGYPDIHRYEEFTSVYRTWEVSILQILKSDPAAAHALFVMSMFDVLAGVPEHFFCREESDDIGSITALGTLKSFSLIMSTPNGKLTMHSLVQTFLQGFLEDDGSKEKYQYEALRTLASQLPSAETDRWGVDIDLVPHVEAALGYRFTDLELNNRSILHQAAIKHCAGRSKYDRGSYEDAYIQAHTAFEIRCAELGSTSLDTLASQELVVLVLVNQGKFKEAEKIQRQVLGTREQHYSNDEPLLWESKKNMADILLKLGNLGDAAKLYEEALKFSNRFSDRHHPNRDSLELMDRLGEVFEQQQKFAEAEDQYRKALDGKKALLGDDSPSTAQTHAFLNVVLARKSHHEQALKLYSEAIAMNSKALGEKHPNTIRLRCNIASLYAAQEHWAKAEEIQLDALEAYESTVGDDHPSTLVCKSNLAVFRQRQGRYPEAETLHRDVWSRQEAQLGDRHPHTLRSMYHLADVLTELQQLDEAQHLLETVLERRQECLGINHPDTLLCMSTLASVLDDLQSFERAEQLYRQCLKLKEARLGPTHKHVLLLMNDLAVVLRQQNKFSEAEYLHCEVQNLYHDREEEVGEEFLFTNITNLAKVLHQQGKYDRSIAQYQDAHEIARKVCGDQSPAMLSVSKELERVMFDKRQSSPSIWKAISAWPQWIVGKLVSVGVIMRRVLQWRSYGVHNLVRVNVSYIYMGKA